MDSLFGYQKCVYLLVGQRGAGKSFYAQRLLKSQPELSIVSRDDILVRRFGSADADPYCGAQEFADTVVHRLIKRKLSQQKRAKVILDAWTGYSKERKILLGQLREYGATRVAALYFVTPVDLVNVWFWQKPGVAKSEEMKMRQDQGLVFFSNDGPARDYKLFHQLAKEIDSDGFDEVIRVDPQKELIVLT